MKILILLAFGIAAMGQQSEVFDRFIDRSLQYGAIDFYIAMSRLTSDNFLICPVSILANIAVLHDGAAGISASEIASFMRLPDDRLAIREVFQKLAPHFQVNDKYTLTKVNKIYIADRFQIRQRFQSVATYYFNTEIQSTDFSKKHEVASKINKWVEEKTYQKIKDLMKPELLSEDTVAVLINTMYFKANWLDQFNKTFTSRDLFFDNNVPIGEVDMMTMRNYFNYYDSPELDAQMIELPYEGDDITLTFVLPKNSNGLSALERDFAHFGKPQYQLVDISVSIPRFKIETTINVKPILQSLGLTSLFNKAGANFPGIARSNESIYISEIIQKVVIDVNEQGSTDDFRSSELYPEDRGPIKYKFKANHPFMFFLKHRVSGILFLGRFINPNSIVSSV